MFKCQVECNIEAYRNQQGAPVISAYDGENQHVFVPMDGKNLEMYYSCCTEVVCKQVGSLKSWVYKTLDYYGLYQVDARRAILDEFTKEY